MYICTYRAELESADKETVGMTGWFYKSKDGYVWSWCVCVYVCVLCVLFVGVDCVCCLCTLSFVCCFWASSFVCCLWASSFVCCLCASAISLFVFVPVSGRRVRVHGYACARACVSECGRKKSEQWMLPPSPYTRTLTHVRAFQPPPFPPSLELTLTKHFPAPLCPQVRPPTHTHPHT